MNDLPLNQILQGDALEKLKELPDESIDCVVTSPPYFRLRDFENEKQIGREETVEEYVQKLVDVFLQIGRILKNTGTIWLNLGDSYSQGGNGGGGKQDSNRGSLRIKGRANKSPKGFKPKEILGIPWRVAFALQLEGFYLRQDLIWVKPNCMPESVTDRFTKSHEYIFLLTKSPDYYFQQQLEKYTQPMNRWGGDKLKAKGESKWDKGTGQTTYRERNMRPNSEGRNVRSVWVINTKPLQESNFATFPEQLATRCINAGCPLNGIVFDPFCGSGTTLLVAQKLKRNFIGIELSAEYIEIAKKRLAQKVLI